MLIEFLFFLLPWKAILISIEWYSCIAELFWVTRIFVVKWLLCRAWYDIFLTSLLTRLMYVLASSTANTCWYSQTAIGPPLSFVFVIRPFELPDLTILIYQVLLKDYQKGNGSWFTFSQTCIRKHIFPSKMDLLYPSIYDTSANYIVLCV